MPEANKSLGCRRKASLLAILAANCFRREPYIEGRNERIPARAILSNGETETEIIRDEQMVLV